MWPSLQPRVHLIGTALGSVALGYDFFVFVALSVFAVNLFADVFL